MSEIVSMFIGFPSVLYIIMLAHEGSTGGQ